MTDNELNGVLAERELDVLLALEQCVALGIFASSETTAAAAAIIRRLAGEVARLRVKVEALEEKP